MRTTKMNNILKYVLAVMVAAWMPHGMAQEAEAPAPADDLQVNQANSLDELLDNVKDRRVVESRLRLLIRPHGALDSCKDSVEPSYILLEINSPALPASPDLP